MGCHNMMCGVSHVPILANDRVWLILLKETDYPSKVRVHPCDQWEPILIPIAGHYDEYGWIKPDKNSGAKFCLDTLRYLQSKGKLRIKYGTNEAIKLLKFSDMSDVCLDDNIVYVPGPGSLSPEEKQLSYMLIHEKVAQNLIQAMPSNKKEQKDTIRRNLTLLVNPELNVQGLSADADLTPVMASLKKVRVYLFANPPIFLRHEQDLLDYVGMFYNNTLKAQELLIDKVYQAEALFTALGGLNESYQPARYAGQQVSYKLFQIRQEFQDEVIERCSFIEKELGY